MRAAAVGVVIALGVALSGPARADLVRPRSGLEPIAQGVSHVIYLNNCVPDGCLVHPGDEDARTDTSSIAPHLTVISPFAATPETWLQVVDCIRQVYSPFDVQIVTDRPPMGTDFHEAIIAGSPSQLVAGDAGGISLFDCRYIPNAISFTFADRYGNDVDQMCWTAVQETAHAWGLDHKFDNRDPMTYLTSGPWRKTFQNEAGPCGEHHTRDCDCAYGESGGLLNSYQMVLDTFGPSERVGPTTAITTPADGEVVAAQFAIQADASVAGSTIVTAVELRVDGTLVSTLAAPPWVWTASPALGQGIHTVKVTAYDAQRNAASQQVRVTLGTACAAAADCAVPGFTCVDGRCVDGDKTRGGLGAACAGPGQCASNQCVADIAGNLRCVEPCDPTLAGCPSGFECRSYDDVCMAIAAPAQPSGGGCDASGGGAFWVAFSGVVLCVARTRTHRRRQGKTALLH